MENSSLTLGRGGENLSAGGSFHDFAHIWTKLGINVFTCPNLTFQVLAQKNLEEL